MSWVEASADTEVLCVRKPGLLSGFANAHEKYSKLHTQIMAILQSIYALSTTNIILLAFGISIVAYMLYSLLVPRFALQCKIMLQFH